MRGNAHVRFGRRPEETDPPKGRHRAPGRPHLALAVVDQVRRIQQDTLQRRGHNEDPLYRIRRLLRRGHEHHTDRSWTRMLGCGLESSAAAGRGQRVRIRWRAEVLLIVRLGLCGGSGRA
jgi:hypothetical protein